MIHQSLRAASDATLIKEGHGMLLIAEAMRERYRRPYLHL